jgi:hypothetical protein
VTVFPAGKKQAKVALPACILVLTAAQVVERRDELTQSVGDAIAAGATGVLLEGSEGTGTCATKQKTAGDFPTSQQIQCS